MSGWCSVYSRWGGELGVAGADRAQRGLDIAKLHGMNA